MLYNIRILGYFVIIVLVTVCLVSCDNTQITKDLSTLAPVSIDGKWGYIDTKGSLVIDTKYEFAQPFSCGLARVLSDSLWGFINSKGEYILYPDIKYGNSDPNDNYVGLDFFSFQDNRYCVFDGTTSNYFDTSGKIVLNIEGFGDPYSKEMAVFTEDGKQGYVDTTGNIVIPAIYDKCQSFEEYGLAVISDNGVFKIIDVKGNIIIDMTNFSKINIEEILLPMSITDPIVLNGSYEWLIWDEMPVSIVIDWKSNIIVDTERYALMGRYINGYTIAREGLDYCVIDTNGAKLGVMEFRDEYEAVNVKIFNVGDGLFAVNDNNTGKSYVTNTSLNIHGEGIEVYHPYSNYQYSNGMVPVQSLNSKWGYLNNKLIWEIEPTYDSALSFATTAGEISNILHQWGAFVQYRVDRWDKIR